MGPRQVLLAPADRLHLPVQGQQATRSPAPPAKSRSPSVGHLSLAPSRPTLASQPPGSSMLPGLHCTDGFARCQGDAVRPCERNRRPIRSAATSLRGGYDRVERQGKACIDSNLPARKEPAHGPNAPAFSQGLRRPRRLGRGPRAARRDAPPPTYAQSSGSGADPWLGLKVGIASYTLQQAAAGGRHPGYPPGRGPLRLDQGRPPAAQEHCRRAQGGRPEVPRRRHHAAELRRGQHDRRRGPDPQRVRVCPRRGHPHHRLQADAGIAAGPRQAGQGVRPQAGHPQPRAGRQGLALAAGRLGGHPEVRRTDRRLRRRGAHGAMRSRPRRRRSARAPRGSTTCTSRTCRARRGDPSRSRSGGACSTSAASSRRCSRSGTATTSASSTRRT